MSKPMPNLPPGPYSLDGKWIIDSSGDRIAELSNPASRAAVAELLIRAEREADATPLDEAFVRAVSRTLPNEGDGPYWHWIATQMFLLVDECGKWSACTATGPDSWKNIGQVKTRGQLRKLAAALGIELKEPT